MEETDSATSRSMRSNRAGQTSPELALRSGLHRRGYRFRVGFPVPAIPRRSIDIAFPRVRLAVFVDGCFWHRCPIHSTAPARNAGFWSDKLARNMARDIETTTALREAGWLVLRIWEHVPVEKAISDVVSALEAARQSIP